MSGQVACACGTCLFVGFILIICLLPVSVHVLVQRVENGTLYTLDFDNGTSTVTYNLSAVFSFRNDMDYKPEEVSVSQIAMALFYGGQKLGADASLPTFAMQPSQTATVPLEVRGQQITGAVVGRTDEEDAARGYYTIEAEVHLRTSYHWWCHSSCMLYFLPPTSLRGGPYMFDGEDCNIKCKKRGLAKH